MAVRTTTETNPMMPDAAMVQQTIEHHFPRLWPAVDLGLSVCATLLLADNANPVAVIYVGDPAAGKTTTADMFVGHPLTYRSDNFTPASFVSHAATVAREDLGKVDLLPRIRYRVLITPELAPIFRGKEDDLTRQFAIITRVLDGQGLQTDSGPHGQRGYHGDFLFAWLGCTTPFEAKVWRVMAQLGSRLFFLLMTSDTEVTVADLVDAHDVLPYRERLARCRKAVHQFLTALFGAYGGLPHSDHLGALRQVRWESEHDPRTVKEWLARCALLLAALRSEPVKEGDPAWRLPEYTPAKREQPYRAHAVLWTLARGHALVHGRRQLTDDDLPLVARVTVSSMPSDCAQVFTALVRHKELTVAQVQAALRVKHHATASKVMEDLDRRGVMEYSQGGPGKAALLRFRPEWAWCASPAFRAMLLG